MRGFRFSTGLLLVLLTTGSLTQAQQPPDFAREVQPLLEAKCQPCHGGKIQMHGLRLDHRADALKGGESGIPAIVPGKSSQSLLYKYVSGGSDIVMPPGGKRLPPAEVAMLRAWIDSGAAWPGEDQAAAQPGVIKGADHWAFQPISRPVVPAIQNPWIRNPIDAFVLQKLQARGWHPAERSEPRALLRRVFLDLTGLPPTLEEQERFLQDPSRLPQLVDDLLSRPTYGERWGRHWLDLVRYADTNGYESDKPKSFVWRYRDYVINAFNHDKPFDRFILEQIAGDELPNATEENFIALGYNRLGPWDNEPTDEKQDRFDQLDEIVSTTSQAFLGLTLGCARCHNHKFEPLSASDYYSMVAIFDGLQRPSVRLNEFDLPLGTWAQIDALNARDRQIKDLDRQTAEIRAATRRRLMESGKYKISAEAIEAFLTESVRLTGAQRVLLNENKAVFKILEEDVTKSLSAADQARISANQESIADLRRRVPDLPRGYYLHEPAANLQPMHLLLRGKAASPGPEVPPAVPAVLARVQPEFPAPQRTSMRRLAFARWLASPQNPLTARVIVNRIWQHHFGEGLVRTPSDFGVMGDRPTHPELLDWLTAWFIDNGWSIKKLHRLILGSSTYQMGRRWNAQYAAADPENRLLWRLPYQRLEVEAIRDSTLAVSGTLNPKMFGPGIFPHIPREALEGSSDPGKIWQESDESEASRRTVYVTLKRSMIVPMMDVLDFCDTAHSTAKRQNTSVASQALTMFNGDFINRQAAHLAARLRREAGAVPEKQIQLAYRLALARPPMQSELATMLKLVKQESLEQMCRVIFNLNEFVYAD